MNMKKNMHDDNVLEIDIPSQGSVLHNFGIHHLVGEINPSSSAAAIEFVLEANLSPDSNNKHLTLLLNSPGGSFEDGFALIDIMAGSKIPIKTTGIGVVASMGLLIFCAGQKGTRTLTQNTLVLSHQWSGGSYGKEHELISARREQSIITEIVIRHLKKHTGLTEKNIRKYLLPANDVWLSALEAKELGLCDIVKT